MLIGSTGSAHFKGMSPIKKLEHSEQPAADQFSPADIDWKPNKPTQSNKATTSGSSLKKFMHSVTLLTLGVSLTLGAIGCAAVSTAQAAQTSNQPQFVQVQAKKNAQPKDTYSSYQLGKSIRETGQEVKDTVQPALDQGKQIGQEIGKAGKQVGQEIGKAGKQVGQEIGKAGKQVGQEIGKAGKQVGKDVAREAKSFWKGLTGK